jgi:hypothetical protein
VSPDRRDPTRQVLQPGGRRAYDPPLTTGDCAKCLGVDTSFVVGEIDDKRLRASHMVRPGGRRFFRISAADFLAYVGAHWRGEILADARHFLAQRAKPLGAPKAPQRVLPTRPPEPPERADPV